jgi:Protein of Unknown function (DUF2604)
MAQLINLEVIVNGQATTVEANLNAPLHTIIGRALAQTNNNGQPIENWEMRNAAGDLLDLQAKIGTFALSAGSRLFLNLKAGVGGC